MYVIKVNRVRKPFDMEKLIKIIKLIGKVLITAILIAITILFVYTRNPYKPLEAMKEEIELLDLGEVMVSDKFDHITYKVYNPKKHIVICPWGKSKIRKLLLFSRKIGVIRLRCNHC